MSKGIKWKDWNPERVKDHVKEQVAENMEQVCVLVENNARRNLLAIQWRPRFKRYRQLLAHLIAHEVEIGHDFVEGRVGILDEEGQAKAGYFIEAGKKNAPAQPWLRPAVFGLAREIVRILKGG